MSYNFAYEALHIVISENHRKSMTSCLSKSLSTPSFCSTFKIPDNMTATIMSTLRNQDQNFSVRLGTVSFKNNFNPLCQVFLCQPLATPFSPFPDVECRYNLQKVMSSQRYLHPRRGAQCGNLKGYSTASIQKIS